MVSSRRRWLLALAAAAGICGLPPAFAQGAFPAQALHLVVPYPPGGTTDAIARLYAEGLARELGQPVVVENRPGAATNIGAELVAKSRADGYTLLFGGSVLTLNSIFGPRPSFDPRTALASIGTVAQVPFMVAANPQAPFSTPREMVEAARAQPGRFSISSAQLDVYVEQLKASSKADVLHIPYKGGAQATTDAIAGQVQAVFALVPVLLPQVQAGKLKAIGVTSAQRLAQTLPQVPTWTETGIDYVMTVWYGIQAPAGVPADRQALVSAATRKVVQSGDFVARLAAMGAEASAGTPEAMNQMLAQQRRLWEQLAATNPHLVRTE